jgi:DNA polymerase III delta prime subunit
MLFKDNYISLLNKSISSNINNKYFDFISKLPTNVNEFPNILLYGPSGIGKYTEALKIIENLSPSKLKYEKKMLISSSKNEHYIHISDIHYEIDMENLTCNSKILFNDIYNNIIDVIQSSKEKKGIILCKNFHSINNEILEFFYSYMQKSIGNNIIVKYIIITEHISFIPKNILDICKTLYYSKLSYSNYIKLANTNNKKFLTEKQKTESVDDKNNIIYLSNISSINTLKYIELNNANENIINLKKSLCNKIINIIIYNNLNYSYIRNIIYDILIYNLNVYDCVYYIIDGLIRKNNNSNNNQLDKYILDKIFIKTCELFKYFNNNYRPIYHLESYVLYLVKLFNKNEY